MDTDLNYTQHLLSIFASEVASASTAYPGVEYNPKEYGPLHLHCYCLCYVLIHYYGIKDTLCSVTLPEELWPTHGKSHYIIRTASREIIDPTLTQFKGVELDYSRARKVTDRQPSKRVLTFLNLLTGKLNEHLYESKLSVSNSS